MNNGLTNADLTWFYSATKEALDGVKDIKRKPGHEVDGEVFTRMRQLSREASGLSQAVRNIFTGKLKTFSARMSSYSSDKDLEVLNHMFNTLKNQRRAEESDGMLELKHILLALQASVRKAESVAQASEGVRKGLDQIPAILEGKDEERRK